MVFAGGIGEDTSWILGRIGSAFSSCELEVDPVVNEQAIHCEDHINSEKSRLHTHVIPTEEALCLAQQAVRCCAS